jgi:prepilin-type N-terminal cleavage/methylation domain-containing protein
MRLNASRRVGFTLTEIMIVVAIVGLIATIAAPNLYRAYTQSRTKTCIANLRQIDCAKQQWALEAKHTDGSVPNSDELIGGTLYLKQAPTCPMDSQAAFTSSYSLNAITLFPTCNIAATQGHTLE